MAGYRILSTSWKVLIIAGALLYPAGRIFSSLINGSADWIVFTGSLWLGFIFYLFLLLILTDIFFIVLHLPFFKNKMPYLTRNPFIVAVNVCISLAVISYGYLTASHLTVRHLKLGIPVKSETKTAYRIALATDIHLGTIIKNSRLTALVSLINNYQPDIVLLAGDIVDEGCGPLVYHRMGGDLAGIRSRYGVYAVTGNHEYIGGADDAVACLEQSGIRFLRDNFVDMGGFYLAGRDDINKKNFTDCRRKPLKEILMTVDRVRPVILMDHQPVDLLEAADENVALVLCGHTHNGQLWPLNYLTNVIFPVSNGYGSIKDTSIFVSAGCGTWGPPVRTSSYPEIVIIDIEPVSGDKKTAPAVEGLF